MTATPGAASRPVPLLGVEEEYLVIDPLTRQVVPEAERVVRRGSEALGDRIGHEITRYQVEARTTPCAGRAELLAQLRGMRRAVAEAAAAEGLRIAATGVPVLGDVTPAAITEGERYAAGLRTYGALTDGQSACALHVHVEIPDRESALLAGNHLRPWLPVLVAMAANSPFREGRDTGHASWRTPSSSCWPVAGPPPYFGGLDDYEELVGTLLEAGVLIDRGTIFWDVRPSARLPTLEVRVTDVPLAVADSALLAMLIRGAVGTAAEAVDRGDRGPRPVEALLRAACWRAARDGLEGQGLDPITGRSKESAELVRAMVAWAGPALDRYGDLRAVTDGLRVLLGRGNGATSQRKAFERRDSLADVVDMAIEQTVSGCG